MSRHAIANSSGFCDQTNYTLIGKKLTSNNRQDVYHWRGYLATRLPLAGAELRRADQIADSLKGITPQSPTDAINRKLVLGK